MRLWLVDPKMMCRKHLLGEHVECHMFVGTINKGVSVNGYVRLNLLEIEQLRSRHDELAIEIERRGYKHKTPLGEFSMQGISTQKINRHSALSNLLKRCANCRENLEKIILENQTTYLQNKTFPL